MESTRTIPFIDIEEMKRRIRAKADELLVEITKDSLCFFVEEAIDVAENILENYVFAVYDQYTAGEFAIKNPVQRELFTNFRTGYQQKMLEWKDQNKPEIKLMDIISTLRRQNGKHWYYASLGVGTAGAIGLAFYCYRKGLAIDRCCLVGIAVELLTLVISCHLYLKEKKVKNKHEEQPEQYETELIKKKEDFVNEVINQLENWLKQGEKYSNKLLTKYNK